MKPFRGKRMGPLSRLAEFNSLLCGVAGCGIFSDPYSSRPPSEGALSAEWKATTGSAAVISPRWKVAPRFGGECYSPGWRWPAAGLRNSNTRRAVPKARAPCLFVPSRLREDCSQCSPTAVRQGVGLLPCGHSGSVAIRSAPYPTRLETRTKESNMCASHGVLRNLKA